jgi:hypothetical protein
MLVRRWRKAAVTMVTRRGKDFGDEGAMNTGEAKNKKLQKSKQRAVLQQPLQKL